MCNIYGKLLRVQSALKVPKSQFNDFGKYNYRSCEDIVEAVKPLLAAENLVLLTDDHPEQVGDRYYIKSTATVIDCESGEHVSASACAREDADKKGMDAAQITGSAGSYARKYALNGLFCIDDTKDPDAAAVLADKKSSNEGKAVPQAGDREKEVEAEMLRIGYGRTAMYKTLQNTYGVDSLSSMSNLQYKDFIKRLKAIPDKVVGQCGAGE